ncbi:type I-B CRISPR-associated protein Cas8b1/Cst1 [Clostridium neuense]|uniref:Type I-B CRISPR-associated protein Cas8b1/Cst1 n=1 Tax=Clostridium neuense TaxID=1728934 RepID=A0ABW8TII4_9CLOT
MKIKAYLNDWFYNMGIIGFIRILENSDMINEIDMRYNYIEFDSSILKEFGKYYFDYFMARYDVPKDRLNRYQSQKAYIKKRNEYKDGIKYLKKTVTDVANKFKGTENEADLKNIADEISKVKNEEQFEILNEQYERFKEVLEREEVSEKLTLNKVRSILSDQYFGQASFLQKTAAAKRLDEQRKIAEKDYILPIYEMGKLMDAYSNKSFDEAKKCIDEYLSLDKKCRDKNVDRIYNKINKKIEKSKDINSINEELNSPKLYNCSLCGEFKSLGDDFEEKIFVPLGISNSNANNLFWNFNSKFPICNVCKLILFCTPAGATDLFKGYIEGDYKDKTYFGFLNYDTDISKLYKENENFYNRKDKESPYNQIILDIVEEIGVKSEWELQNILFVEFDVNGKNCKLNYFNIPRFLAKFFAGKQGKELNNIKNEKFKSELVDLILKNIDIKFAIDKKLRQDIKSGYNALDCYIACKTRYYLNMYREGKDDMKSKTLFFIYKSGQDINKYFTEHSGENKISGIAYKMLNSVRTGNKNDFMDAVLRTYMAAGQKQVPQIFSEIFSDEDSEFESVAQTFIAGLISNETPKKQEGANKNE